MVAKQKKNSALRGHELSGNEWSVQKSCACQTKSFFKAVMLYSDFFVAGNVGSLATHKVKTFTDHTVQGNVHVQCQWLTFIKTSTTHLFILVRNNKLFISCFGFFGCENFYDTAPVNLFKTLETFSISFFMGNCKMSRDHGLAVKFAVCSSRLNGRKGFWR